MKIAQGTCVRVCRLWRGARWGTLGVLVLITLAGSAPAWAQTRERSYRSGFNDAAPPHRAARHHSHVNRHALLGTTEAVNALAWSSATAPTGDLPVVGDYDGDGKTDLGIWRPANGTWYFVNSSSGYARTQQWGLPGDIPVPGDYDNDGKTDFAVWRPHNGVWYVINSLNGQVRTQQWGLPGDIPTPGDYDNDNKTDFAVWRPQNGVWYIINSLNGQVRTQQWGLPGDIPVPGDYDGDNKTDTAVWRPANGVWYIINSSNGQVRTQQWGLTGDVPVPGDYDGDQKTDTAVWRPANGVWYIINSANGQVRTQQWGLSTDVTAPGDYDGDGKVDCAIWRPAEVNWYFINSGNGTISVRTLSSANAADLVRLLEQTTFGPTDAQIARLRSIGAQAFLSEQFAAPVSTYQNFPYYPSTAPPECSYDGAAPTGPASICNRDNYSLFQVQLRFFQNAMTAPDQLRQRVAFALSQIFVVSGNEINMAYAMAPYQQMLRNHAFGNFRQLLNDVTLSPAMGRYLDMVNNGKGDPARGTEPNENYARELLQLFSIGEVKLNLDGTRQLDGQGQPIPAYDQDAIEGFAKVFTGWTYPVRPGATPVRYNPTNYEGQMVVWPSNHDTTAKELLDNFILQGGQTPEADLNAALDNIFNHPNVGPFISRQLIQHLVTSNPSPAYVARVATVFNDNGQGVRGDLRAVVQTILLDAEARGDNKTAADYGHLREPVLFVLNVLRALGGQTDGVYLRGQVSAMGQNLFYSPSVFNYFPPDYGVPGTTLDGPEFAILNSSTSFSRANFINSIVYSTNGIAPDANVPGAIGTKVDLAALQALAGNPAQLVEKLNELMLHNTMSTPMKNAIITAVQAIAATDTLGRARQAAYLVATSSQYQVER